jgi:hypothetical protein
MLAFSVSSKGLSCLLISGTLREFGIPPARENPLPSKAIVSLVSIGME